jgi:excinuclease ABC subunit B
MQVAYNLRHQITPQSVIKGVRAVLEATHVAANADGSPLDVSALSNKEKLKLVERLRRQMREAAKLLEFERAAQLRDAVVELEASLTVRAVRKTAGS